MFDKLTSTESSCSLLGSRKYMLLLSPGSRSTAESAVGGEFSYEEKINGASQLCGDGGTSDDGSSFPRSQTHFIHKLHCHW